MSEELESARAVAIDGRFVAGRAYGVETLEIDGEALVFDRARSVRTPLNPTAALIWACFDGTSTLGEIASDLADGLDAPFERVLPDVIAIVDDFVARGIAFDVNTGQSEPAPVAAGPRPLLDADFPLGDDGELHVRVGGATVRTNDPESAARLRRALAPSLTNALTEQSTVPRLSLMTVPSRGRVAGLHYLYRGDELAFRSATRGRLLRATLAFLDGALPHPSGTFRLHAHALVGKKGVVLVGGAFREMIELAGPRLARAGWTTVDAPAALVDGTDLHLVVAPLRIDGGSDAVAAIAAESPPERGEGAPPGRYAITHLLVVGSEADPAKVASPSQRLAGLLPLLADLDGPILDADVERLWALAQRTPTQWVFGADDRDLLATLDRLAGRTPRPPIPLPR